MKNIYKVLNEIEIDDNEWKEAEDSTMEVTDLEKASTKKALRNKIRKGQGFNRKGLVAAALASVMIGGTLGIGIINPTYAAQMPIVGDIFRFLDNGRTGMYDLYKENAYEINVTKESNGISMTIKDAVFDGKTVYYTYEVQTDKDLGESPMIGMGASLEIKGYRGGLSGSSQVEKLNDTTYIGTDHFTMDSEQDKINCKLDIEDICVADADKEETIKGTWNFEFELEASETVKQEIGQSVEADGFKVTIDYITQTPMSYIINYTQEVPEDYRGEMDDVSTSLAVKDNLGNVYEGEDNGGSGNLKTGIMKGSMTFSKLDENAAGLIITPEIFCTTYKGGVSMDEDGTETAIEPSQDKEDRTISLDEVVVDLAR